MNNKENRILGLKDHFFKEFEYCKSLKAFSLDPTVEPQSRPSYSIEQRVSVILQTPELVTVIRKFKHLERNQMVLAVMDEVMRLEGTYTFEKKINLALKTALGILTEGVVSAPRDGLLEVKVDEEDFLRLVLAGPIRAAGGSLMGLLICYAELLRIKHHIGAYKATEDEIEKTTAEVNSYFRLHPAQVTPSSQEVAFVVRNCPIMIDGIQTESEVVPYNKHLKRLPCGKIRGGACLAIVEGLIIRAKKIESALKTLDLNWTWLSELKTMASKLRVAGQRKMKDTRYTLSIGRPLISTSENSKGLRVRIGKAPTNGLCGAVVSHELIDLLKFLNIGTQLVVSEPGKGCSITGISDDLEKPIVKYKDDSVDYYSLSRSEDVKQILDLGQVLINLGDFVQFKTVLKPRDYDRSLWRVHTQNKENFDVLKYSQLIRLHRKYPEVKLHPYYNLFLKDVQYSDYVYLRSLWNGETMPHTRKAIKTLDELCCPYVVEKNLIRPLCRENLSYHLLYDLGIELDNFEFYEQQTDLFTFVNKKLKEKGLMPIGQKGHFTITARIGRPENVSLSAMKPDKAYSLANYRPSKGTDSFWKAIQKQPLSSSNCLIRLCEECNCETAYSMCPKCNVHTRNVQYCLKCKTYFPKTEEHLHKDHKTKKYVTTYRNYAKQLESMAKKNPVLVDFMEKTRLKLVKNNVPYPEPLIKGLLRAKYGLPVTKDGTIGLNAGNASTTHFTPEMLGLKVQTIKKLGYYEDHKGVPLESPTQVLALKPNDVIYPRASIETFKSWTKFIDDLLVYYYDTDPYYEVQSESDLLGTLVMIIAPHISNGVVSRIVGFSENLSCYTHPLSVTTRRRDQDGDIDRTCLLMDCLLNCSRKYVSEDKIGALMSIPLTLSLDLTVDQTGKEILYCQTFENYGTYPVLDNTRAYKPDEIGAYPCYKDLASGVLSGRETSYNTPGIRISSGSLLNLYKDAENNENKVDLMVRIEELLNFVNNRESLEGVIEGHIYPDLRGNLNAYYRQDYRCSKCGKKENRDVLSSTCLYCKNGSLRPTVYPRMALKYVKILKTLVRKHELDSYFRSKIKLILEEANELQLKDDDNFLNELFGSIE